MMKEAFGGEHTAPLAAESETGHGPTPGLASAWQQELLDSYTSVEELARAGFLSSNEAVRLRALGEKYRVRVPRYYAGLMDRSSPEALAACVIRRQAVPGLCEDDPERLPQWAREWSLRAFGREVPWDEDAIGDLAKLAAPRLTHRYGNRAILHLSSLCALYCRFCFRKSHLNAASRTLYNGSLEPALAYLERTPEIRELILTGGDPLSLPDPFLARLFERLSAVANLKQVRIHSRMAVTLPSRLTPELAALLERQPFGIAIVSHFNHPRELTKLAVDRLRVMRKAGVALYNQSVLLREVNDDARILETLFQELYENGVRPFYLHHADWTPGTFGFRVSIERGRQIVTELAGKLSGPATPQYVLEIPGGGGKVSLMNHLFTKLSERHDDAAKISGALWQAVPPHTRSGLRQPAVYAEFWRTY